MSIRLDDAEVRDLLTSSLTGIITTLRADGRPVALPTWFVLLDDTLYLRTPSRAKKIVRVRRHPHGTFLVERGRAWAELTAWHSDVDIAIVENAELAARAVAALDDKYAEQRLRTDDMPTSAQSAYAQMTVLALTPVGRPLSWANAKLLQRH